MNWFTASIVGLILLGVSGKGWASAELLPQENGFDFLTLRSLAMAFGAGALAGLLSGVVRSQYSWIKRGFDIFAASVGLLACAPFLAAAMLLIRLSSPGPSIFTQERLGRGGRIFKMYKLRTMVADAERMTGAVWAQENDPRVTWIGRWLRKTHFDEVPQLLNVLKGQMSLIGPRPERPEIVSGLSREVQDYHKRLAVAPGMTGLAQVWSRYDETIQDVRRKVKYDLLYIRQMCLTADLGILLRTVYIVSTGQGAR